MATRSSRIPEGFLYQDLARQIADAIRGGSLQVGDRIPSVRKLSAQYRVSISTAVQALRHLENQRLIEARPKSGFFVARQPHELREPATSRPPASPRYVVTPSLLREYLETLSRPGMVSLGSVLPEPAMFPSRVCSLPPRAATRKQSPTTAFLSVPMSCARSSPGVRSTADCA
jgi:DNA-binding transcriptional MocR family regulator